MKERRKCDRGREGWKESGKREREDMNGRTDGL